MRIILQFFSILAVIYCELVTFKEYTTKDVSQDYFLWWNSGLFYQIYPSSFRDKNNDGYGDLAGIIEKLQYLTDTKVTGIWISSIFKSPQVDQGYDISDYRTVDPIYGTNKDLQDLIRQAHALGLKVLLDFVPNHTSDQHEWFLKSVNRTAGYEDYYVWVNGTVDENGNRQPPNNWISNFKGSAWEWNQQRQQYYLHQFSTVQPDLNFRNKKVIQELQDVLTFWLDYDIDGFRLDAAPFLVEDESLQDEPLSGLPGYGPNDYEYLDHNYTKDQNETFNFIYDFRELLDNYTATFGGDERILITEAYTSFENLLRYFRSDDNRRLGAHFSFNFDLITNVSPDDPNPARVIFDDIRKWYDASFSDVNQSISMNWVLGNHDNHRVATRLGVENVDGYNMLTGILNGIQVTYNGEEIGQENGEVTCEEGHDPQAIKNCSIFDQVSRDFERTPFQWDSTENAGFNNGAKPWLPISPKAEETNLALQSGLVRTSHYNNFVNVQSVRQLLRENEPISNQFGVSMGVHNESVIEVIRTYSQNEMHYSYLVIFNLSQDDQTFKLRERGSDHIVWIKSINSAKTVGDKIDETEVYLAPHEALILKQIQKY